MNGRTNTSVVTIDTGGVKIPLEVPTAFSISAKSSMIELSWTDPVDKSATPGGEVVAVWDHTDIIRKTGSAPISPDDGDLVLRETSRDQYNSPLAPYVDDNLENNVTYYYAAYAYTTDEIPSDPATGNGTPKAATPKYTKTIKLLYRHSTDDYASGSSNGKASATTNHAIVMGNGITAVDSSLTTQSLSFSQYDVDESNVAQFNGNAVFTNSAGSTYINVVDPSLTFHKPWLGSRITGSNTMATNTEDYLYFAGAYDISTGVAYRGSEYIGVLDKSFSHSNLAQTLSGKVTSCDCASTSNHAIFSNMILNYRAATVAIDNNQTMTSLNIHAGNSGANVGKYALFSETHMQSDLMDPYHPIAYNSELTAITDITPITYSYSNYSTRRNFIISLSMYGFAMFIGGYAQEGSNAEFIKDVDCYDTSLTKRSTYTVPTGTSLFRWGDGVGRGSGQTAGSFGGKYGIVGPIYGNPSTAMIFELY